jgi:hypothetical protein
MGKQPWQQAGAFNVLMVGVGGSDLFLKVYKGKDAAFAAGPEVAAARPLYGRPSPPLPPVQEP